MYTGTCRDASRTQYKSTAQNTHHQWSPSFLRMKGGYFTHLHVWGTNWREELGDLYSYSPFVDAPAPELVTYCPKGA